MLFGMGLRLMLRRRKGHDAQVRRWFADDGDKTHRLNYPLDADSLVFDLGGFEGQWASDVYDRFGCHIHVFEPVEQFVRAIERRFEHHPQVVVHPFGLASERGKVSITVSGDGSSIFTGKGEVEEIALVRAAEFFEAERIGQIDLMKINIEGGEYDLLEHLIEVDLVKNIRDIQVQFHNFIPNAQERTKKIQRALSVTHKLTYQYPFVWENWTLRRNLA
jgi:FkbM family methyltransferase